MEPARENGEKTGEKTGEKEREREKNGHVNAPPNAGLRRRSRWSPHKGNNTAATPRDFFDAPAVVVVRRRLLQQGIAAGAGRVRQHWHRQLFSLGRATSDWATRVLTSLGTQDGRNCAQPPVGTTHRPGALANHRPPPRCCWAGQTRVARAIYRANPSPLSSHRPPTNHTSANVRILPLEVTNERRASKITWAAQADRPITTRKWWGQMGMRPHVKVMPRAWPTTKSPANNKERWAPFSSKKGKSAPKGGL